MEIYKDIKEYEGRYQVSNMGNVKSLHPQRKPMVLKPFKTYGGYLCVHLRGKTKLIHRLVSEAFIGEIPDGYEINHIDFNQNNNTVENLEICTHRENVLHSYNAGRIKTPTQR